MIKYDFSPYTKYLTDKYLTTTIIINVIVVAKVCQSSFCVHNHWNYTLLNRRVLIFPLFIKNRSLLKTSSICCRSLKSRSFSLCPSANTCHPLTKCFAYVQNQTHSIKKYNQTLTLPCTPKKVEAAHFCFMIQIVNGKQQKGKIKNVESIIKNLRV